MNNICLCSLLPTCLVNTMARKPNMTPPTTSPTATRIALSEARDFLFGPNLETSR